VSAPELYGKLRTLFSCGALPVAQNAVYFLKNSSLKCVRMPTHLSFDDFIAACQRPLRRSIRVNTLKITVDDFCSWSPLWLAADAGSVVRRGFLDRA
jgi:hypothetical protein